MDEPQDTEFDNGDGSGTSEPDEGGAHADENARIGSVEREEASEDAEPADAKKPRLPKAAVASKTSDLDALLDSLNGSAERFQTLWFSFLGLTLYLAIAALTTTHRNLLLGEAQTLPLLNIKVPLLPFYVIAPLLYLVFHFYVLMMLVLLARTAAEFEDELRKTLPDEAAQERYRARVENALFLQFLVGMRDERTGGNSYLLATIALITIVLAPLATLILMQMMFLPYHSFGITWWHRALVLIGLAIALVMWRRFFCDSGFENPLLLSPNRPRLRSGLVWTANLAAIYGVLWISLGEGQWAGENQVWLMDYDTTANGVVFGLFPDRLNLSSETIVGEEQLEKNQREMASRGGDFVPTINLDGRDLQAAELSAADLRDVSMRGAIMQGADLGFARMDGANLAAAQLQGADLGNAQLQGARLELAQLPGANLFWAQLQGADLTSAQLQGADLFAAHLQGAELSGAQLQGAYLPSAQLQGADLSYAQLQGADLGIPALINSVTGNYVSPAHMAGVYLNLSQLPLRYRGAQLQGANLRSAQLQGAILKGAETADSEFYLTLVFRTDTSDANLSLSAIRSVRADSVRPSDEDLKTFEPLTPADVDRWTAWATWFVDETQTARIVDNFARLKPSFRTVEQDAADQEKWSELEKQSLKDDRGGAQHRGRLATILGDLACGSDGAPYVARGLMLNCRLASLGDQLNAVRAGMEEGRKDSEKCPGVVGFTEADWRYLEAIKPVETQNPAPPPAGSR